ncbi:MAG: hypothetical protein AAF600_16200 [Bacteroidota bacterium]
MSELNGLSETIRLHRTYDGSQANFFLFFGDKPTYVQEYETEASDLINSDFGLFSITWNRQTYEISSDSACIDIVREFDLDYLKHSFVKNLLKP